jgi:hypothetical protein
VAGAAAPNWLHIKALRGVKRRCCFESIAALIVSHGAGLETRNQVCRRKAPTTEADATINYDLPETDAAAPIAYGVSGNRNSHTGP